MCLLWQSVLSATYLDEEVDDDDLVLLDEDEPEVDGDARRL